VPKLAALAVFILYAIGYRYYSGYLSRHIFQLRDDVATPAHQLRDGVDYVPSRWYVLLGHHYASITGLAPILGPAVAVIWGWLPAMLWVVLGTLFIGAVHDFSALVLSIRSKGLSIGSITEYLIGKRAKMLFLLIIFFLIALAMGAFILALGMLFSPAEASGGVGFPGVVPPSAMIMAVAMLLGYFTYKRGYSMKVWGFVAFAIVLLSVWVGQWPSVLSGMGIADPATAPSTGNWKLILLVYAFIASVLPVWLLLQSRDYLNSMLLVVGLLALYLGFFVTTPLTFDAPPLQLSPKNAPPLFPFVFIVIACGAVSGFHALVSSGTTAKQLDREKDARIIGYGGMIGESILGLIAVLATTTALGSTEAWQAQYADWENIGGLGGKLAIFVQGGATFVHSLGIPVGLAEGLVAFVVVSFALTSLDSATRLLRYNIEELSSFIPHQGLRQFCKNRYLSAFLACVVIGFFAFYKIQGQPAGFALWQLFGTTNQLLGALALLLAAIYLFSRGINPLYALLPMIFLLVATATAMTQKIWDFAHAPGSELLLIIGVVLVLMTVWLIVEAVIAVWKYRNKKAEGLDILQ
jgi:carbon starvation protein